MKNYFTKSILVKMAFAIVLLGVMVLPASAASGIFQSYIVVGGNYYDAQATTANPDFSAGLGSYTEGGTLTLNGGKIKTYKNGLSNVTSATMYYNIHLAASGAGAFSPINLPFGTDLGNGDQEWVSTAATVNILSGLTAGNYNLEVYFQAASSDGTLYDSNSSANYKASFTVNAPTATPVTPTATPVTPTATNTPSAPPNWVGNMSPVGGSSNSINEGGAFDVYVQVLQTGTTDSAGQGLGITCTLHYGQVSSFGTTWISTAITDTIMSYNKDIGNNDEYKTTISPNAGLYEFTAFCSNNADKTWRLLADGGNGKLTVNAPTPVATSTPIPTATATSLNDNNVQWNQLYHSATTANPQTELVPGESFAFRQVDVSGNIFPTTVTIYMLTDKNDLTSANLVYSAGVGGDQYIPMTRLKVITTPFRSQPSRAYDVWQGSLPPQPIGTTVYYRLQANDATATAYLKTTATFVNPIGQVVVNPDVPASGNYSYLVSDGTVPSNLAFVGNMFPSGGYTHSIPKGAPVDVYLQVYKSGVTPGVGAGVGISCVMKWSEVNNFGEAWLSTNSVTMVYNTEKGNNDEYMAKFTPQPNKKYEFTAFCNDGGTPVEQNTAKGRILALKSTVFIQLFEWKWKDIATECEQLLGPKGFGAVQVSPPQEHALVASSGGGPYPWWQRYQPVSYQIISRSGNRAEFQDMVSRCNAVGVEIYADAVINHMANGSGTGSAGTAFADYNYPATYTPADFHSCKSYINDYTNKTNVQNCELAGLDDLDTGSNSVRDKIAAYLNDLISLGVSGFRLDAAKHILSTDIEAIVSRLTKPVYIYSEVIASAGEGVQAEEYLNIGQISEFKYGTELQNTFRNGKLADLDNGGVLFARDWAGFLSSNKAVVFTDNHDNQRGHGGGGTPLTYRDGSLYILGNVFVLAWPYGYPSLISSYTIQTPIDAGTTGSVGPPTDPADSSGKTTKDVYVGNTAVNCAPDFYHPQLGQWLCEQHQRGIGNMVAFRNYVAETPSVDNWWTNGNNQIAFSRGNKGFVLINRESSTLTRQFTTGLPDGTYCNVIDGDFGSNSCSGSVVVVSGGLANITVAGMNAVAIYGGAKLIGLSVTDSGLTMSSTPSPSVPGQSMTYTLGVTNVGVAVNGLIISAVVPSALTNPTWTCQADGSSSCLTASGSGNLNQPFNIGANGQVTFIINGTLANGTSATVVNQATLVMPSSLVDTNWANNSATNSNTPNTTSLGSVTLVGTFQSNFGCAAWDATCAATRFTLMGNGVWRAEFIIPAGSWAYKAVLNNDLANSYPSANKTFTLANPTTVRFYYDDKTKTVYDSVSGKVAVAVGSFQSELGCVEQTPASKGDWEPSCVRTLMTDPNNDGTYTFQTSSLPAGSYQLKVALNESWAQSYPPANVDFSVNWKGELVTIRWNSTTNAVSVDVGRTRAFWIDKDTLAWNPATGGTFKLRYAPTGGLDLGAGTGNAINLTESGVVNVTNYPKFPNIGGYRALKINAADLSKLPDILKGQLAVSLEANGELDATGVQIQGVLDDLYTYNGTLGISYSGGLPTLKLWAPTAKSVTMLLFDNSTTASSTAVPMTLEPTSGVWSVTGQASWDKKFYLYDVEVYVHATGQVEHNLVTDPYAVTLSVNPLLNGAPANTQRSQIVDLYNDASLKPTGWDSLAKPPLDAPEDSIVYELHVRDFSINDSTVPVAHRGTFMAFTDSGSNGMSHLKELAEVGLTHIHLLPVADSGTMVENKADQKTPGDLSGFASDSEQQQAAIKPIVEQDGFNWGYETQHFGAAEGAYSTNPDGAQRVLEFREMVKALSQSNLRVVMDVVYNHTYRAGQDSGSVLDKVVPGYYQRCDKAGNLEKQSCCPDTASEFNMTEKLIVDTVLIWAKAYKVDGFRFDLMNFETVENIVKVKNAVQSLTPATDGVDGSKIYLYGEGWDFGSAKDKGLHYAKQWNMAGTGIGTFNDKIRDAAHGGYSEDPTAIRTQGFINGLSYDWNGYFYSGRDLGDLRAQTDKLRLTLAGSLQNYQLVDQTGNTVPGKNLGGYTLDPQETVNYVEKHDNETLYDQNIYKLPINTSMADRVRAQDMGLSLIGFAQGIPFFQAGSEMLRSKSLDRDSYNSGDWFNRLDFTYQSNNFGVGLPPGWRNDPNTKWPLMKPLLANSALKPTPNDLQASVDRFKEMLKIRHSSKLFRLRTADEIMQRVKFYNTGPSQKSGLIVMSISDKVGTDLDPQYKMLVVLFNANKVAQTFQASEFMGVDLNLHGDLYFSNDPVVKTAMFDKATGNFSVPARTTVVFVEQQDSADLAISQSSSPKPAVPGSAIVYTIVVSNGGYGLSNGTVFDTFPTGLTNVTWNCTAVSGASCANGSGNINEPITLPAGGRITYTVSGLIGSGIAGQLANTASVTVTADTDPTNNQSVEITPLTSQANLSILNISSPSPGEAGKPITYTITVENIGPSNAVGAVVVNNFPSDVLSVNWTCTAQTAGATCGRANGSGNIYDTVNMPVGGKIIYLAMGTLAGGTDPVSKPITNTAVITSPIDPDPSNNSSTDTTAPKADMVIMMTSQPTPFIAGQTVTYTIVVSNAGPNSTQARTFTDLPTEFNNVSWTCSSNGSICTATGTGKVDDTIKDFPAGKVVTYVIKATLNSATTSIVTHTANVQLMNNVTDPNPYNNKSIVSNSPARFDLAITTQSYPTMAVPGENFTYTILVSNNGPAVVGAKVVDAMPTGLSNVTWRCTPLDKGGSCTASGTGNLNESVNLALGSQLLFTITAKISASLMGTLVNTVTITAPSGIIDPNLTNNTAVKSNTLSPQVDLVVSLSGLPNPAVRGELVTYTLTVWNGGPSDVKGAKISSRLPILTVQVTDTTWTCLAASGSACGQVSGIGNVDDAATIMAKGWVTYTIVGIFNRDIVGQAMGEAEVTLPAGVTDPTTPNYVSNAISPRELVDLVLTKQATVNNLFVGDLITYTLTVSNEGTDAANVVTLVDVLPIGLAVELSAVSSNGTCIIGGQIITCTLSQLDKGAVMTLTVVGQAMLPGTLVNTATVSSSSSDANSSNNSATVSVKVMGADLSISMESYPQVINIGNLFTYTLSLVNNGTDEATNVTVTANLPTGVAFVSANTSANCQNSNGLVSCLFDKLANGAKVDITIIVTPVLTGTWVNTATVTAASPSDPTTDNNVATTTVRIVPVDVPLIDLVVSKQVWPLVGVVNQPLTYTIVLTNRGPAGVSEMSLVDMLPNSVAFASIGDPSGLQYSTSFCQTPSIGGSGAINCRLTNLVNGAYATIAIVVTPTHSGRITNTVTAIAPQQTESNPNDNSATVTTVVGDDKIIVTPSQSYTLTYIDKSNLPTTLIVPANAVTDEVTLLYTELDTATLGTPPMGFNFVGHSFTLNVFRGKELLSDFRFNEPITMTLGYTPELGNEIDESSLMIYYWDTHQAPPQWVDAATSCTPTSTYYRQPDKSQVSVKVCHLTDFALFGQPKTVKPIQPIYLPIVVKK